MKLLVLLFSYQSIVRNRRRVVIQKLGLNVWQDSLCRKAQFASLLKITNNSILVNDFMRISLGLQKIVYENKSNVYHD